MVVHSQVQQINDLMFIIVPGSCPGDERTTCDSCEYSTVKFKTERLSRHPEIQIGYVSCSYQGGQTGSFAPRTGN